MDEWRLTDLAAEQIDKLEADGIHPTPQQVLDIQCLSLDVAFPVAGASPSRGVPVKVGNVTLWPMTIAASFWLDAFLPDQGDLVLASYGIAYALAKGSDASCMSSRGERAVGLVSDWAKRLTTTREELAAAVSKVIGYKPDLSDEGEEGRDGPGLLVQAAVALCGGAPELWEYQCSLEYVAEQVAYAFRLKSVFGGSRVKAGSQALKKLAEYVAALRRDRFDGVVPEAITIPDK